MSDSDPANDSETLNGAATVADPVDPGAGVNTDECSGEETIELLEHFPPEIASLLIMAGAAGVLLPGPVGLPLLIAGGVILWPKTFRPIELWFSRKCPVMHREGVVQLKEFIADLNHRFPEKK